MARILYPSRPLAHLRDRPWGLHLRRRLALRRQRLDLARLDTDRLRDIGLAPDEVARETTKSFWSSLPD